ncbi:unnamed protein product [Rhizophagus irregularis]|nr:unnamed protein product [Rhizophagus irregularis]
MVDNKFLPKLSQDLLEILDDDEYYDITIEVVNKKNDGILVHIKLPNILPEIFHIILRYLYGGKLPLEEYDILDIIKILVAANKLNIKELNNDNLEDHILSRIKDGNFAIFNNPNYGPSFDGGPNRMISRYKFSRLYLPQCGHHVFDFLQQRNRIISKF